MPWPDCECHGEPVYWTKDDRASKGGYYKCSVAIRASQTRERAERKAAGTCVHCGDDLATETLCQRHADERADLAATPYQRMLNRAAQSRYRQRLRNVEGFHPSGVGVAAFAALIEKATGEQ